MTEVWFSGERERERERQREVPSSTGGMDGWMKGPEAARRQRLVGLKLFFTIRRVVDLACQPPWRQCSALRGPSSV